MRFLIILLVLFNLLALAAWRGWLGEGDSGGEPERITNQLHPERIRLLSPAEVAGDAATPTEEAADPPALAVATEPVQAPDPTPRAEPADPPEPVVVTPPAPVANAEVPAPSVAAVKPPASEPAPREAAVEPVAPPGEVPVEAPAAPAAAPAPPACVAFAGLGDEAARRLLEDARAQRDFETRDIVSTEVESWWVMLPPLGGMAAALKRSAELRALGVTDQYIIPERGSHPYGISLGLFQSAASADEQRRELTARGVSGIEIEERGTTAHRVEVRGPSDRLSEWASSWASRQPRGSRLSCRP